jgi:hopanoid biosynthesis associated protein HpnK
VTSRQLIVNADDMGLTEGHNRAIVQAHSEGILTSASLLACGMAFDDAVVRARTLPGLGVGIHLTLLEGTPLCPPRTVPDLVVPGEDGTFGTQYGRLLWGVTFGQVRLRQVSDEWRAQIVKVLESGLRVTHLDSHKHVHMHPQLLGATLALADEYGISRMRLSRPARLLGGKTAALGLLSVWARRRLARRGIRFPGALLGLETSGQMTAARLRKAIQAPWSGTRELMTHPAYPSRELARLAARGYRWIDSYRFGDELAALCSRQTREAVAESDIELVTYESL